MMLSGSNLTFNITFDASVSSLPQAEQTQVRSSVAYIETEYETDFPATNPATINITVVYDPTVGLAASLPTLQSGFTYSMVRTALLNVSPGDAPDLPVADPTNGGAFQMTTAEAKVLGLAPGNSSALDGTVYFGTGPWAFYPSGSRAQANDLDFTSGLEHEFSEVMGRISQIGRINNTYTPFDMFRYSASGRAKPGQPSDAEPRRQRSAAGCLFLSR